MEDGRRGPRRPTNPLAELRAASGLTMTEVAEAIHVTRQAIGSWEAGQTEPSASNAAAYARTIGVDLDVVIDALHATRSAA